MIIDIPQWFQKTDKAPRKLLLRHWHDVKTTGRTNRGNGYRVGESHHLSKITDDEVELMRILREGGLTCLEIAKKFDCARTTVSSIVNYNHRTQIGMGMNLVFE
jgi:DNA-binding CsgD family transcriptional regulator